MSVQGLCLKAALSVYILFAFEYKAFTVCIRQQQAPPQKKYKNKEHNNIKQNNNMIIYPPTNLV